MGLRNFATADGCEHSLIGSIEVSGNQQEIVSGFECIYRGSADVRGVKASESCHVESIGDDKPLESELRLEQIVYDRRRSRSHALGVGLERGEVDPVIVHVAPPGELRRAAARAAICAR